MRMFDAFNSIPFLGKYKTVVGGLTAAVGAVGIVVGQDWGRPVLELGVGWLGIGVAHRALKDRVSRRNKL